jgi:cyclin-dependent kinase
LGTPNDDVWPGVTGLPDYKSSFPNWHAKDLADDIAGVTEASAELIAVRPSPLSSLPFLTDDDLKGMLVYDPAKRMSAKVALACDYFRVPGSIKL